ncbi:hypothetical protein [Streptomyces sp. NPDC020996]|uniref:hypothetical protein n=1 Tax=Streptomyces sp. NPDC020996 TaxID=3154791 RepID=UPI0033E379C7
MPLPFALTCVGSDSPSPSCDCLAHRFGDLADGPRRVRAAARAVSRPGREGRGKDHRVMLDAVRYLVDHGVK